MSDEFYFPGLSEKTQYLNDLLTRVYNFRREELNENAVNHIASEIKTAESDLIELDSYSNKKVNQIKQNIKQYSVTFDLYLSNLVDKKSSELENILSSIHSARNNLPVLDELRKKADSIDDYINNISSSIDSRDIDYQEIFNDYSQKRESIGLIKNEISILNERYDSALDSGNKKELKSLLKSTIVKGIFKTGIYKRCIQSSYYEGIIQLTKIHDKVKFVLSNRLVSHYDNLPDNSNKSKDQNKTHPSCILKKPVQQYSYSMDSSFSHLHALINTLDYPQDYSYLKLRDTLRGKYSDNWQERLNQFAKELIDVDLTESGREYLSKVDHCLKLASNQGQYVREIISARKSIKRKLAA